MLRVGFDEADVAAAFETRDFDFFNIFRLGSEAQIFLQVVIRNKFSPHGRSIELTIFDNDRWTTFDDFAESVGSACDPTKDAM